MDANKLKKLQALDYTINPCCGNCSNANRFGGTDFSTCMLCHYEHEKHSESERELSINRFGVCGYHEFSTIYWVQLGPWTQFVKG